VYSVKDLYRFVLKAGWKIRSVEAWGVDDKSIKIIVENPRYSNIGAPIFLRIRV